MKTKRAILIFSVLLLFLIACGGGTPKETVKPTGKKPKSKKIEVPKEKKAEAEDDEMLENFVYMDKGRRNPFSPMVKTKVTIDINKIRLVGIMWEKGNPIALVEDASKLGYMLREGDFIDDHIKVLTIQQDKIIFDITEEAFHKTFELKLGE